MFLLIAFALTTLTGLSCQQDQDLPGLSSTAHVHSTSQGVCPFTLLSDRNGPLAAFGVYKPKTEDSKFGYLILFQPQPERKEACKLKKVVKSAKSTETSTDFVVQLTWDKYSLEIDWEMVIDERTDRLDQDVFKVDGKQLKTTDSRLLLAKLEDGKVKLSLVKGKMPSTVPDATTSDDWTSTIQAAIAEARSSSKKIDDFLKQNPAKH